ncbi:MAG: MFS transporter [Clostridiales bacterium]|nr:MFS transporter [Clostridiales bacterium]
MFLTQTFQSLSMQSVNILIARYATESLGVSPVIMGNLVGMYFGVALAMRPIAGPMQAKLNKRNLLLAVYFTGGIVNLGYALFNSTSAFIFFRILQGIQYSFMGSLTMTLAVESLPRERMASGVAMYTLGGTVMQTIGPNLGLWMRDLGPKMAPGPEGVALGYKFAFFFAAGVLAVAVIPLFMIKYNEVRDELANAEPWYRTIISKHTIPMTIVVVLVFTATSCYRGFLDPFAKEAGIPNIGLFSTVSALVMLCTRPISGRIMDRAGMKKIIPAAMVLMGISLVVISRSRTLPMVLFGGFLSALGSGFVTPGLNAMCMQTEIPSRRAVASNTLFAGTDMGSWIGPIWGGMVVNYANYSTAVLSGLAPLSLALVVFLICMPGFTRRLKEIES